MAYVVPMALSEPRSDDWVPQDTFASRLALVRQALGGWNIRRAATYCDISAESWRQWEKGVGHPRDYEDICAKISAATGCDLRWLKAGSPGSTCMSDKSWSEAQPDDLHLFDPDDPNWNHRAELAAV